MSSVLVWGGFTEIGAALTERLVKSSTTQTIYLVDEYSQPNTPEIIDRVDSQVKPKIKLINIDYVASDYGVRGELRKEIRNNVSQIYFACQYMSELLNAEELAFVLREPINASYSIFGELDTIRVCYLSSLFIAGDRVGAFTEYDVDCGQVHNNDFESAQYLAEKHVRKVFGSKQLSVYRLPILYNTRQEGNGLLPRDNRISKLKLLISEDKVTSIYGTRDTRLPIATLEYVADLIDKSFINGSSDDGTYHIVGDYMTVHALCQKLLDQDLDKVSYKVLAVSKVKNRLKKPVIYKARCEQEYRSYLYNQTYFDAYRYNLELMRIGVNACVISDFQAVNTDDLHIDATPYTNAQSKVANQCVQGVLQLDGMQTHIIEDVEVSFWDVGGGSKTIVFCGGILGPESWFSVVSRLRLGFRCIVIGIVGASTAKPNKDGVFDIDKQVSMIKGILSYLKLKGPYHMVASDMAVPVISRFCERWKASVSSLIFSNPLMSHVESKNMIPNGMRKMMSSLLGRRLLYAIYANDHTLIRSIYSRAAIFNGANRLTTKRAKILSNNILADFSQFERFCYLLQSMLGAREEASNNVSDIHLKVLWSCGNDLSDIANAAILMQNAGMHSSIKLMPSAGINVYEECYQEVADTIVEYMRTMESNKEVSTSLVDNHSDQEDLRLIGRISTGQIPREPNEQEKRYERFL